MHLFSDNPLPSGPPPLTCTQTLLSVAIHSLNNEAGRTERIVGIESKFFVMQKLRIIAGAFIFIIEVSHGRPEVFSFILVLPHSEMQEYLTRFEFYEAKVHQLLLKFLIDPVIKVSECSGYKNCTNTTCFSLTPPSLPPSFTYSLPPYLPPSLTHSLTPPSPSPSLFLSLNQSAQAGAGAPQSQARLKEYIMKEVAHMDLPLQNLAQLMHSLRYNCLPTKYNVRQPSV